MEGWVFARPADGRCQEADKSVGKAQTPRPPLPSTSRLQGSRRSFEKEAHQGYLFGGITAWVSCHSCMNIQLLMSEYIWLIISSLNIYLLVSGCLLTRA